MNGDLSDARPLLERLTPEDLPRLAIFFASYLGDEPGPPRLSAQQAAFEYVTDAELDELQELAGDWAVLRAAVRETPLPEINRVLGQRFGTSWQAVSRQEIEAIGAEFERALRE
ncbi:MAG TPA: hypothetical protein VGC00_01785 [Thermoanaerobaculia bacterium]|jgi:hypothetical protein